jgi:hypothetical protein
MKNLILAFLLLLTINCFSQDTITTNKTIDYKGKMVCLKGKVASFKTASDGQIINYINIDKAYPDNIFNVIITNSQLEKLKIKVEDLKDKIIYVKGTINIYDKDPKQTPQIFNPISIEVKKK